MASPGPNLWKQDSKEARGSVVTLLIDETVPPLPFLNNKLLERLEGCLVLVSNKSSTGSFLSRRMNHTWETDDYSAICLTMSKGESCLPGGLYFDIPL